MNPAFLFMTAFLVGTGRFFIPGHDLSWAGAYEAFAHIWVGILVWEMRGTFVDTKMKCEMHGMNRRETLTISTLATAFSHANLVLFMLTVLEVAMFVAR